MGSIGGEDWERERESHSQHEGEKIYVAVRARPLSDKEIAKNDLSDWECISNTTIIYNNSLDERSMLPTAYTFDRVFGFNSPTKHVYDEAAKKIALSVLSGINSTIFAYGQTGSGKTFTMCGITEYAIADIYDYIDKHRERKFVLKFCAMEIYNEAVRDLLRSDAAPLRLLDDPERGTRVANLTEVTLKDSRQLRELLSICQAQRKIGETSLNELSSRSHQILRLTVESEALHYMGAQSSSTLTATVNFVDLAGSERASQTLSAGTRLKEGCHINRSLLTLGTVIRKLSKGGKSGHIPYRDSKLTRILQTSLGGNARTAIICTMSPAHSHVEQSRNTLHFANCAKQVHTNAQVNVVMSEKALVKQLQKELARMESEMKHIQSLSHSGASKTALREKELLIQKMDQEIRELTQQRDMAQIRVENILRSGGDQSSKSWNYVQNQDRGMWGDEYAASEASEFMDPLRLDVASRASNSGRYESLLTKKIGDQFAEEQFLFSTMSPRLDMDKYFGPDPCQGMENDFSRRNSVSRKSISKNPLSSNSLSRANSPRNTLSPRNTQSTYNRERSLSSRNRELGLSHASSPYNREHGLSPRNTQSPYNRDHGLSPRNTQSPYNREHSLSQSNTQSPYNREHSLSHSNTQSPYNREYGPSAYSTQSLQNSEYGLSTYSAQSPRNREFGLSPRNRVYGAGRSFGSSDFEAAEARARTDKSCEAILEAVLRESGRQVAKENEKVSVSHIETVIPEKVSVKKTLAALMRENSRRFSDAKSTSDDYYWENFNSPRLSDAKSYQSYSDALSRQNSGKLTQSSSVPLSRDDYRKLSDVKSDALSRQSDEQSVESPRKQQEHSMVIKTKAVKQTENDLETEDATPKTAKKAKKERRSSGSEEKAKKERRKDETAGSKTKEPEGDWKTEFERRKREIIKLWDACHIPLVHRSYFCLLFKGDPSDAVYMEVEHRRLSFLKAEGKSTNDEHPSSPKALQREREMLSRRMLKKLNTKEREALFQKWGIDVKSKQRRQQLCSKLWTDTDDMEHINESAAVVAKLAGLKEAGQAPKEMFGLNLATKQASSKAFSWRHPIPSII